jgi:uncharacterized OsmC-like protein/alpha-beta hydrolase superfamily lysophospholipase
MAGQRFDFPNAAGDQLAALLDRPAGAARATVLFAHCFTCGKDVHAARRIAEGLTELGFAVLRFDFTGLGASEGEFANTTFSSNVGDLVAAADHLRNTLMAPALLIGHSLGGAAVLAAADRIPEARAVVTIAAPSDPGHVTHLFKDHIDLIRESGEVEVSLAGRPFKIRRAFIDDIAEQRLLDKVRQLRRGLLIFHSPVDQIVGIENASDIFLAAKHPKSFISLADADHLLSRRSDAAYVANVIAAWSERYLDMAQRAEPAPPGADVIIRETGQGKFQQEVRAGRHRMLADEPLALGGLDSGPTPYQYLLAGLGACTAMTLRLYAEHKAIPLEGVEVALSQSKIHAADCEDCETREGKIDRIERIIALEGPLDSGQRARLLEIADKCPVHRTLTSEVDIRTLEAPRS